MTSNKPYLLRALYEWILDNDLTPHVIVDVTDESVEAPSEAVKDGKLVLNISPNATRDLVLGNDSVTFETRFSGRPYPIFLPIDSVMAIYARENGQGMMFARDAGSEDDSSGAETAPRKSDGPSLKVVK
ncbi:MAG: ClpXP protease specificity-enhancing factor [Xanthomonadales bacterium]|nr:ClpXP protease specificity-enhancing factor [Xanthomonadales bacterium]